jgi:hypothetical protein
MAATLNVYQQVIELLCTYPWDDTENNYKLQLVDEFYAYDATHTTINDIDGYALADALAITGRTIDDDGSITCDDMVFVNSGSIEAAGGVIYLQTTANQLTTDKLLAFIDFNDGALVEFTNTVSVDFGVIISLLEV